MSDVRSLLAIDPADGSIIVGYDVDGMPIWGLPDDTIEAFDGLIAAAEARGYAKAIRLLREEARRWAEDTSWSRNCYDSAAFYLETEATKETTDHA